MRSLLLALALLLSLLPTSSRASVDGLFWDPAFNGEGWSFDSANDSVAFAWYSYEDGQPTYRTGIGTITYTPIAGRLAGAPDSMTYSMQGRLYRTQNFTQTTDVGGFSITFTPDILGDLSGTMNAAGQVRQLRQVNFNVNGKIDEWHGAWLISGLGAADVYDFSLYMDLNINTEDLGDGRVGRKFVTIDDDIGYVIFDSVDDTTYISFESGTSGEFVSGYVLHNDTTAFGEAQIVLQNGTPVSDVFILHAQGIANTEGEYNAFSQLLDAQATKLAKRLDSTPAPVALVELARQAESLKASRTTRGNTTIHPNGGPRRRTN